MTLKKLPIGIQDFEDLIKGGNVYVDKTRQIYEMISSAKPNFLSRPRRFGKSLLVSTLHCLFRGKKDLFKGLWIEQSDWDWQVYPIIRLDMSSFKNESPEILEKEIKSHLVKVAAHYEVTLEDDCSASALFVRLIEALSQLNAVVVLIDEYDKPLLDQIARPEIARRNRDFLRQFYGIMKAQDHYLKLVFLTGVSKFSKVSIFSGLNNLNDLTMANQTSDLLGYTREEIDQYLGEHLQVLSNTQNQTIDALHKKIKHWYNGYQFSTSGTQVYNPFSLLRLLNTQEFKAHWFETGTPTFLVNLIKDRKFDLIELERLRVSASVFNQLDIEHISLLAALYQAGYLTIKTYHEQLDFYHLGYPNYEVNYAFAESLMRYFEPTRQEETSSELNTLSMILLQPEWDQAAFFEGVNNILKIMPYDLFLKEEKHYHSLFYLILKLAGIKVGAEIHTHKGRVDAAIVAKDKIILFEFKLNQSAKAAIKQIKEKEYYTQFSDQQVPIYLAGINFNSKTREMDDWRVERL